MRFYEAGPVMIFTDKVGLAGNNLSPNPFPFKGREMGLEGAAPLLNNFPLSFGERGIEGVRQVQK